MEVYTSENEQVEALQRWLTKNARFLITLLILTIGSVWGWRAWNANREASDRAASIAYEELLAQMNEPAKADAAGRALIAQYPNSEYAVLGSLAMAATAVEQNSLDAAAAHLRYALEHAHAPGVKQVAATRLARILLAQQKPKDALQVLDGLKPEGFGGEYNELQGDIQLALGNRAAAYSAYRKAVADYASIPSKLTLVQMKLDDVADAAGSGK